MAKKSDAVPENIRRICSEWSGGAIYSRPTMKMIAKGHSGCHLIDLLLEVVVCLNSYKLTPKHEESLRKVSEWVLSQAPSWTIDEKRGVELDRSKGLESGLE